MKIRILAAMFLGLTACGSSESTDAGDDKTIRVATSPGPYSELFQDGVAPILEEEGYTVDVQNFTDLTQATPLSRRAPPTSTSSSIPRG